MTKTTREKLLEAIQCYATAWAKAEPVPVETLDGALEGSRWKTPELEATHAKVIKAIDDYEQWLTESAKTRLPEIESVVKQVSEKTCLRIERYADGSTMTCLDYYPGRPDKRCECCNAKAAYPANSQHNPEVGGASRESCPICGDVCMASGELIAHIERHSRACDPSAGEDARGGSHRP